MRFLSRFFSKKNYTEEEILNLGLEYAMAFGKQLLQPIQNRLSRKIPHLSTQELDRYDEACRAAMNSGVGFVWDRLDRLSTNKQTITSSLLRIEFETFMKDQFAWVDKSNLNSLLNRGIYFAWRDGIYEEVVK